MAATIMVYSFIGLSGLMRKRGVVDKGGLIGTHHTVADATRPHDGPPL